MDKLTINLLPANLQVSREEQVRQSWIAGLSIIVLLVTILVTGAVLAVNLMQKLNQQQANADLEEAEAQVSSYKEKEGLIAELKSRLGFINQEARIESVQVQAFNLISGLIPQNVVLTNFSMNKANQVIIGGEAMGLAALDSLFENLSDPRKHDGRVSVTQVENLNKSQDNLIRFNLTINLLGATLNKDKI